MEDIKSHPDLFLSEHIAQVHSAARTILASHSSKLQRRFPDLLAWLDQAVRIHDVGKASREFQKYILAPSRYRGSRERKAHPPLSMLVALATLREYDAKWKHRLAVAAAAACHHSGFRTRDELEHIFAATLTTDALTEQLSTFPWSAVSEAVGIPLHSIQAEGEPWMEALDDLEEFGDRLDRLSQGEGVLYRLRVQLLLSVLLEADKAYLAIAPDHLKKYIIPQSQALPAEIVERFLATKSATPLNPLRHRARQSAIANVERADGTRIFSVTLPTGMGKTMLAANWALRLREKLRKEGHTPKIVIVLPFLSIIDQTQKEYMDLLKGQAKTVERSEDLTNAALLLSSHSLAERVFDPEMDDDTNDFFVDTWQSEIVITTFDQFLFALMAPAARYQMRFHILCDSLIVMDEIQALPCKLWHPLNAILTQLVQMGNSHVLAMSATQPGFIQEAQELITDRESFFALFGRYRLKLRNQVPQELDSFVEQVVHRSEEWTSQRTLITLNTRRSARIVRDALEKSGVKPLYFLSADVTPEDRLKNIDLIKKNNPCVVVSTQCIEAGVDIDMDLVLRDFAPLDSILQVAGRCNRNGKNARCSVEVYHLVDENGRAFAEMIYDSPLLQATRKVLDNYGEIDEEVVLSLATAYFEELRRERDTGEEITKEWARWQETNPVRQLLRGQQPRQESFVVVEQDPGLPEALTEVKQIQDRWERRRWHRALSPRLARVSVSLYARPDLDPSDYADRDPLGIYWLLRPGYYDPNRGIDLKRPTDEASWGILL